MACHGCTTKFSFFQKEYACSACGFGFCSKCLKQKAIVPNKGSTELPVCKSCFRKITTGVSESRPPPDVFLRRLESLENPSAPPITIYRHDRINQLRSGLSEEDQHIADRLARLRAERCSSPPPSETEIRRRLANLKGENYYSGTPTKQPAFNADLRSDQQKVDDLLEQYAAERNIELAHDPTGEIEARIASLRDAGVQPNSTPYLSELHDIDSSDEESQMDKITRKIMDEVAIDSSTTSSDINNVPANKKKHPRVLKANDRGTPLHASTPELSFCVICYKQGATTRCIDCDGDLYCTKCFTEIHRDWSETHHKSIPYTPRPSGAVTTSEEDDDLDEDED